MSRAAELSPFQKAALAARVWLAYARVRRRLRRTDLPALVATLRPMQPAPVRLDPVRLGDVVDRVLRPVIPDDTCLQRSLVLFTLLRGQGDAAELVIGLPDPPVDERAHAWVEVARVVVGPPPGRAAHRELARYG